MRKRLGMVVTLMLVFALGWSGTAWAQDAALYQWMPETSSQLTPPARVGHRMVWDSHRKKVILFGGQDSQGQNLGYENLVGQLLNDIWEWDPSTRQWANVTSISGSQPSPRSFFGMAYDPARRKVVVYGGKATPEYNATNGETWEWDPSARTWTSFPNASPLTYGGLRAPQLAFDPSRQRVIEFGGITYWGGHSAGTFAWNGNDWIQLPIYGPEARIGHALITDSVRNRVVLFGGWDYTATNYQGAFYGETWELDEIGWTQTAETGPPLRYDFGAAYDESTQKAIIYGGSNNFNDTWVWDGESWVQLAVNPHAGVRNTALVFAGDSTLMFGGRTWTNPRNDTLLLTPLDDTPPLITPTIQPAPSASGWSNVPVTVSWTLEDSESGVASSVGCESITIASDSTPTLTCTAKNGAGMEANSSVQVSVDLSPPVFHCESPDESWHATDVALDCVAADALSGLSSGSPVEFTLASAVPAGAETANALTNGRTICDLAENCVSAGPVGHSRVDKKGPVVSITSPSTVYQLNQSVVASYSCEDGGSGVGSCVGSVPNGANVDTTSVGTKTFMVHAADVVGNASNSTVEYAVGYGLCLLYDVNKAHKSGSTIPIKLQLCDAAGTNLSSSAVTLTATGLTQWSTNAPGPLEDSGQANPDFNFRYDAQLGGSGGYIFNLSTSGLAGGTWAMTIQVTGDPTAHATEVRFQIKP